MPDFEKVHFQSRKTYTHNIAKFHQFFETGPILTLREPCPVRANFGAGCWQIWIAYVPLSYMGNIVMRTEPTTNGNLLNDSSIACLEDVALAKLYLLLKEGFVP